MKNKIFKMKEILQKKLRGKDQLEHMTKKGPALKASEEGESRDRRGRRERKISLSQTYGLNVIAL